jgi:hypothetical protein
VFDKNAQSIEAITFEAPAGNGDVTFGIRIAGTDQRLAAGHQAWRKGTLKTAAATEAIAASGAWSADDTYTLNLIRYRTPFATTYRLQFAGDRLIVNSEQNVGPADTRTAQFEGKVVSSSTRPPGF